MDLRFFSTASALLLMTTLTIALADRTSHCKVKWLFGILCQDVSVKLVNQIKAWRIEQSCLYSAEMCSYEGEAASEFSKDPAGNSTNYCSLQNLMDGSDLVDAEGYKQFSNKWICPGIENANCSLF